MTVRVTGIPAGRAVGIGTWNVGSDIPDCSIWPTVTDTGSEYVATVDPNAYIAAAPAGNCRSKTKYGNYQATVYIWGNGSTVDNILCGWEQFPIVDPRNFTPTGCRSTKDNGCRNRPNDFDFGAPGGSYTSCWDGVRVQEDGRIVSYISPRVQVECCWRDPYGRTDTETCIP